MNVKKLTSRFWRPRRRSTAVIEQRRDTHVTAAQSPLRVGIDAQMPNSMPRGDEDAGMRERSVEFHDRPGSGKNTANRRFVF
jgi:hypothetical protein